MDDEVVVTKLREIWGEYVKDDPRAQLAWWREREPNVECRTTIHTPVSRALFVTLCSRFGIELYWRKGMQSASVCLEVPRGFMDNVLSPAFDGMADVLEEVALRRTEHLIERWTAGNKIPT